MFGRLTVMLTGAPKMQIEVSNKTHANTLRHTPNKYVSACMRAQIKKGTHPSKQTHPSPVVPISGQVLNGQHAAIKFIRNPTLEGESAHEGSNGGRKKGK